VNVSAKVEYACLALLELAVQHEVAGPTPLKKIAEPHRIPTQFLVQILLQLKAAGLVLSSRGVSGGYQLAMPPDQIRLGDVVRAVEGTTATRDTPESSDTNLAERVLREAWQALDTQQWEFLDSVTFAQLVRRVRAPHEPMYYI
jgi:Rrf2 family cysteine metabolism transcriptional repressor